MRLPSASGLQRAFACPASRFLPRVTKPSTVDARRGTAVHKFLEECGEMGRERALERVPEEYRDHAAAIDMERMPIGDGVSFAAEVALAWDCETGDARELARGKGREEAYADAKPTEFVGTLDLLGLTDDSVVVMDPKTGWGWTPPAAVNWQLRFAAIAATTVYGKTRARVAIVKLREDGSPWFDWHEVEALDLAVYAAELRDLGREILAGQPSVVLSAVEGEHCAYCPSFAHCPAKARLAVSLGAGSIAEDVTAALTPETAAKAWERIKLARAVLKEVEAKLEEYALNSPVTLTDGQVLGPVESESDDIDDEKAAKVLDAHYGPLSLHAVAPSVTKKGIEKMARHIKETKGGTIKEAKDMALALLRKHGAVVTKRRVVVKEHRPEQI